MFRRRKYGEDDGGDDERDEDFVPEEEEEEDNKEEEEDEDDDNSADEFLPPPPSSSAPRVFTFYTKSELRKAKREADATMRSPEKDGEKRGRRRRSTAFSPMAREEKKVKNENG